MSGVIRFQLVGNVGKDATVNTVNGKYVINFSLAHTQSWLDPQGVKQSKTRWFDCAIWRTNDKIAPYIKKGSLVYVEGIPDVKKFTRQSGEADATIAINVEYINILDKKQQSQEQEAQYTGSSPIKQDEPDEMLPF